MLKKSIALLIMIVLVMSSCTKIKPVSDTDENGRYILPEKLLKLTVWNLSEFEEDKSDADDVSDVLKEKTNVTVSKIFGNNGKIWTDRLAQLVMDGQLPNLVNAADGEGMVQFLKLDKIKKVYKLTEEEIKQYAPELWKRTPEKYWEYLKNADGDIIGIPYDLPTGEEYINSEYGDDIFPCDGKCLWIRDDILKDFYPEAKSWDETAALEGDFLGDVMLDVHITTTEEYIHFLYDIANGGYTSQNGKKVFAFGYCEKNGISDMNMLGADMYGYKKRDIFTSWKEDKINFMLDDEIIYNAFKTQNQMIYDGIIDGGSIYDTEKEYVAKVFDGRYAIISPGMNGEAINKILEENGSGFRYRPFLTNITSEYTPYKTKRIFGGAICILNNLNAAQVHQVLNWINAWYGEGVEPVGNPAAKDDNTENRFKFSPDSPHISMMEEKPTADIKNSMYAAIPEVTELLNDRDDIERNLIRFLMKSPDEFDAKWNEFIEDVHKIADISAMEQKMTDAALK